MGEDDGVAVVVEDVDHLPVGEDDAVAVVVEDVDHGVRLHKGSDLAQHQAPLQLVFGLVGRCVLIWKKSHWIFHFVRK